MNITLDSDTADRITRLTLTEHIELVKDNISMLARADCLDPHKKEDLNDDIVLLASLERVARYFGS